MTEKNTTIFRKYQTLAETNKKVLLGGRLAQYTYADMDDTVEAALSLWNKELQNFFSNKINLREITVEKEHDKYAKSN